MLEDEDGSGERLWPGGEGGSASRVGAGGEGEESPRRCVWSLALLIIGRCAYRPGALSGSEGGVGGSRGPDVGGCENIEQVGKQKF